MKAVLFDGKGFVKLADVAKPKLQTDKDAVVKITHAAICGSDLNILKGKIVLEENGIMGHEGAGVVEEVGASVEKFRPGDRVVISYTVQCGECPSCRSGMYVFCDHGGMFGHGTQWGGHGGTHTEYLRIPFADAILEPIPSDMKEEDVLFVGDILSTGYMATEYGSIKPGDVVVVYGAGPVGLCTVASARLWGPSLIVSVDVLDYRLDAAKRLGADVALNAAHVNAPEEIKKIVTIQANLISKRLEERNFTLKLTDGAKELLANTGFDPVYGARPLKRTIQHLVQDPLAMKILEGSVKEGTHITVDAKDGELVFE